MIPKPTNNKSTIPVEGYADAEVILAIRSKSNVPHLALKWFFEDTKGYAIGVWRKKYRDISDEAWEDIFTDATIKLITRIQKGLELQKGTKLKSYFTTVVEYTVLDHFAKTKKERTVPVEDVPKSEATLDSYQFEEKQIANLIKNKLIEITENAEQVKVILLAAKGYRYKEIVEKTTYQSEGACRNAFLKGKKRIVQFILENPEEGRRLKQMISGNRSI